MRTLRYVSFNILSNTEALMKSKCRLLILWKPSPQRFDNTVLTRNSPSFADPAAPAHVSQAAIAAVASRHNKTDIHNALIRSSPASLNRFLTTSVKLCGGGIGSRRITVSKSAREEGLGSGIVSTREIKSDRSCLLNSSAVQR